MKRVYFYSALLSCILVIVVIGYFCWFGKITTAIVVRHAEKAATPSGNDPLLSAAGIGRAKTLSHVVEDAGIDAIFATEYQRTQATVKPTADHLGLPIIIIPSSDVNQLIDSINASYQGKDILIAGHSNTVPEILEAMGVTTAPVIAENTYDNLFVVQIRHCIFRRTKMTHLKYGIPSP